MNDTIKINTQTKSGTPVLLIGSTQGIEARFSHPKLGNNLIMDSHGWDNDKDGMEVSNDEFYGGFLQIPKGDYTKALAPYNARQDNIEKRYQELINQLPEITLPPNTPSESRFEKLQNEINQIQYFSGSEDDGLNAAQSSRRGKLQAELMSVCNHKLTIELDRTFTEDGRRKVVREVTCTKCGFSISHHVAS